MSILRALSSLFAGFNYTYSIPLLADQETALRQHSTPHPSLLLFVQMQSTRWASTPLSQWLYALQWIKTSWLVIPFLLFLPFFIHLWPRQDTTNPLFEYAKSLVQKRLRWIGFFLNFMEKFPIKNKPSRFFLDWLDQYLLSFSFIITCTAYIGLYLLGYHILALTAGLTLFLSFLDRKNRLPLFLGTFYSAGAQTLRFFPVSYSGHPLNRYSLC